MDATTQEAVETFLGDNKLSELCEVVKIGDDLLDVINLSENQHSDLLAWMFDPREGHGQGDQIIRDLLLAASNTITAGYPLDGRSTTSRFFTEWTPSRIRSASFGSVFTARELGMNASERVDLFVIDPTHKFVLLIENKAGTAHSEKQLDGYRKSWQESVAKKAHLKDYSCVLIALDRAFETDVEDHPSNGYWLHMGYDWLKPSADRAVLQLERGNLAARLVVSYCTRQSNWESPVEKRAIALAAGLHETHANALKSLLGNSTGRLERNWFNTHTAPETLFLLQNKAVFSLLRQTQGMASLKETLATKIPLLHRDNIYTTRTRIDVRPPGWEKYTGEELYWPVFFRIRYSDHTQTKYDLALVLDVNSANSEAEGEELRESLQKFDRRFDTHLSRIRRRVVLAEKTDRAELVQTLEASVRRLLSVTK
ncbi:hypothetical protein ERHA54_42020 [Erwinia rhapontici]|uniref:PD-(D/E)XK nuclease superfamily protein n=1 Tax=Erwinia rhapontici TaxID=55212 RepID=A0ABM7N5B6_ERWRD|nr:MULTISPECIES: PD-(D/E)XK nuclease family protein [Erwinia]NNS07991.1 PD-(D/E)XK nuclease family protein [Erwinia sp. JH02]BCQ36601.1 hypothetical protein ERHA53_39440 [Erwinia rhapontici]BCQ41599.1 hypothetical protein ERHA54_42020 [Erwinia rhapontici]